MARQCGRGGRRVRATFAAAPSSLHPDHAIDGAPLGRTNKLVVRDLHRVERRLDLAPPMIEEVEQHREIGRKIILLPNVRSEEHTSELQSLMRISYAVFCFKKKKKRDR